MTDSHRRAVLAAIPLAGTLCAIAGAVDAIGYLLFGKIFIANMTGNTVFFAVSMLTHNWREAALRLGVVLAFLAGILVAHMGLSNIPSGRGRQRKLIVLAFEFVLLSALTFVSHPDALRIGLLLLLAFALAMQNSAFRQIGPVKLNTAFISGDLENLGEALADSAGSVPRTQARLRTAVFITTWIAYALGGLLGAYGALHFAVKALWVPAGFVILASIIVLNSPESSKEIPVQD